jgi:transcriptional regulator with XRE-family HTH domain
MLDDEASSMLNADNPNVPPVTTWRERIEELLRDEGITQADLARRCKITRSAVNQWFSGQTRNPKPEHIFVVSDHTGYAPRWLATGKLPKKDSSSAPSEARDLYRKYAAAPQHIRDAIDTMLSFPYEDAVTEEPKENKK